MRLIVLFILLSTFLVQAKSYSQKVSYEARNVKLEEVLKEFGRQTGYYLFYKHNEVRGIEIEHIKTSSTDLDQAMKLLFKDIPFEFNLKENTIIVNKLQKINRKEQALNIRVVQSVVKGVVRGANGDIIAGATISIKGTTKATMSGDDGSFEIGAEQGQVLIVSLLGYATQTINIRDKQWLEIMLAERSADLDEIVVIGYGTQKKEHLTGAVSQISSKELMKAPMPNVSNMLTGKLPGLTSLQRTGKPGADGTTLYVRGINSFGGGNGPMILIDGVPGGLDHLNPNDIETVSILKDAAAAIYGIQGANGVILVTTKKGKEGPAQIIYDGSLTYTDNTAMPEMLNAPDYMFWHNKARTMDGLTPMWSADIQNKVMNNDPNSIWGQTDWMENIFRIGQTQQHNISATGGSERTSYYTSLGIMDQEGTMIKTDLRRLNVRSNLDINVAKDLKFTVNLHGYRTDRSWPGTSIDNQGEFNPVRQSLSSIPIIKDHYNGYNTAWRGSSYNVNGYAALTESGYINQTKWNMDSNAKLEYDFSNLSTALENLKISIFGSYNYGNTVDNNYSRFYQLYTINPTFDEAILGASGFSTDNVFTKSASWGDSYLWRPQIDYARDFGSHFVNAMLLFETRQSYSNTMTGMKRGYYSDDPVDLSLGTTLPTNPITGSHVYGAGYSSYVGRFNYAYSDKYLAEMAFRYDGTYIFAPGNQWGFFPSASLGWVLSKESFFADLAPVVDHLKLRASYGRTGNDAVDPFQHNALFSLANNSMVLGDRSISQFYSTTPYLYRNLTWATTDSYNVGMDLELWHGKLGVEVNLFYKLTQDILESQSGNYPSSLGGYFPAFQNSGKVENKGFELSLKHNNRINSDWSYGLKADVAFAKNKVLSRIVSDNRPNYRPVIGESIGARYGFKALGLFQTQEEIDAYPAAPSGNIRLGDLKYLDYNGDGIISSDFDYVKIGYGAIPEFNFAFNMDVSYKNFFVSLLWQGVANTDYELSGAYDTGVISSTLYTSPFGGNGNSPYYLVEDAWTPENTNAKYPRLTTLANGNNAWQSSWWVVNGNYLRLKNANIGYNIPEDALRKTPFSRVSVFVAGFNLLTFSHFKYVDPESPSVSNGYYPQQKTYTFGLNMTF